MKKNNILGMFLLLGASLIWGIAYIPTRYLGTQNISVLFELTIRYTPSVLIFGFIYFKDIIKTPFTVIKNCVLTGFILFLAIVCSIYGIRTVQYGSIGILLLSLNVVFVPLYFAIFHKHNTPKLLFIASILSFIGSIILTTGSAQGTFTLGIILCILASFGYTAYIILCSKILTDDINPGILQFFQAVTFLIICIPIVLLNSSSLHSINWTNPNLWYAMLFIGFFAGTLGYQLFFYGQKISHPIVTALILASQTVFSAFADLIIFKIELNHTQILAYTCIIIAVFIVPFQKRNLN